VTRYQAYSEYKDSGLQWLGPIPTHWELMQSRRLFAQRKERARQGDEQLTASQKYGVIYQKLFMELEGQSVVQVFTGADILKHVEKNDFVISMRSFQGGLELCSYPGCVSSAYVGLIPIKHVRPEFFKYLFKCSPYIQALQSTSNLVRDGQALRFENFSQVHLPCVPDDEQKKIAAFLDHETAKIDALIEKQQRLIELLKEKRQAVISHAVTKGLKLNAPMKDSGVEWLGKVPTHWDIWKLAHAFSEIGSGTTPRSDNFSFYENGEIPWLNTGDLNDGELDECEKKISNFALKEHSTLKLYPANSLAIAMYGATIAKVALLRFATTVNQACCVFGDSNIVSIKFLFYWILGFRAQIISLGTGGGQPNISQEILRNLRLACPNVAEQTDITNYLDIQASKFAELIKNAELFIQLLRERRTALISAAVTGKIDVRDWQAVA
jgi:type I restriction enzyme S subunit